MKLIKHECKMNLKTLFTESSVLLIKDSGVVDGSAAFSFTSGKARDIDIDIQNCI